MKKLYSLLLLAFSLLVFALLPNCNTQNGLLSTTNKAGVSNGAGNGKGSNSDPIRVFVDNDAENVALQDLYERGGPFEGIDPRTEIIEKRTAEAKHFRNPDGTITAIVGAGVVHYQEDGQWKTISTHPHPTGNKTYPYSLEQNIYKVFFPSTDLKEGLKVDLPNELQYSDWNNLKINWLDENKELIKDQKVKASDISVKGEVISYNNLLADMDATITNYTDKKKVDYVIHSPKAFEDFHKGAKYLAITEDIELEGMEMVDIVEGNYYGKIEFKDRYNNVVMSLDEAKVYDESAYKYHSGKPYSLEANIFRVNYRVSNASKNKFTLETIVPIEWLQSENRTFPITIDPVGNYSVSNSTQYTGGTNDIHNYCIGAHNDVVWGWYDVGQIIVSNEYLYFDNPYIYFGFSSAHMNGFATYNLTSLQTCEVQSALAYWNRYYARNAGCGNDVDVRLGNVNGNYNAGAAWQSGWDWTRNCGTIYNRIDNNENDYSGEGRNGSGWQNQNVKIADIAGHVGDYFTYGWNYLSGDDLCTWCVFGLCTGGGDDSEVYHARPHEHSSRPYIRVTYRDCGDQESFGDQVWHVHAYNNQNLDVHALVSNGSYRGKYIASEYQNPIHNQWRWQIYSAHWWGTDYSPSWATGIPSGYSGSTWNGSAVGDGPWKPGAPGHAYSNNFTTAYKRQGFPCGQYQIRINNHDDNVQLQINDNQNIYTHNGCCDDHTNVWNGILDESSRVTFVVIENGGGAQLQSQFYLHSNWTGIDLVSTDADGLVCLGTNVTLSANNIGNDLPAGNESILWETPNGNITSSTISGALTKADEGLYKVTRTRTSTTDQGGECSFTDYFNISVLDMTPTVGVLEPTCRNGNDGQLITELPTSGLPGVRSIRLYQMDNEPLNVNEIEVYDMQGTNIASAQFGGVATQSSQCCCSGPSALNDGDLTNACGAHTNSGSGQWMQISWSGAATIDYVRVYNRINCCWNRLDNVQLRFYAGSNGTSQIYNSGNIDLDDNATNGSVSFVDYSVSTDVLSPSFSWTTLGSGQDQTSVSPGNYTLTVTPPSILGAGCTFTSGSINVPNPTALTLSATTSNEVCPADNNGSINLSYGGYPTYSVPQAIPNLKLWVRGDAGVKVNKEGYLEEWQDLSGNNNGFYPKFGPGAIAVPSSIGNLPAVGFSGNSIIHTLDTDYTGQFTMFVVGRKTSPLTAGRLVSASNKNWLMGWWDDNYGSYYAEGWINNPNNTDGLNSYIYSVTKNGSNVQTFRQNGVQLASNSNGTHSPGQISLGGWGQGDSEMSNGEIAEVIYYSRNLSTSEIYQVEEYLSDRYGITAGGSLPGPTYLWSNGYTGQDPSGLNAGSYTVTMTDFNGCTVNGGPYTIGTTKTESTAPTGPGTQNVCNNQTINLTASGGTHGTGAVYQWYSGPNGTGTLYQSSPSTTLSYTAPSSSGTYHVYLRRSGDCNTTSDHDIVINVNASPTAYTALSTGGTSVNSDVCVTSLALTPVGGSNGSGATTKWYSNAAMTTLLYTGVTYTVNPQALGVGTHNFWVRRESTGPCAGTNSPGLQVSVVVTGGAPTNISAVVDQSCWATDNINEYEVTVVVQDNGSGIGGTYGILANINYDLGSGLAGGYFSWHPSSYVFPLNQMAATGGGFASQQTSWGSLYNTLVSCTTSWNAGTQQRTVTFRVRPNGSFIESTDNDVSVYSTDLCNNTTGWGSPFETNFTSYQAPLTTAVVNNSAICVDDNGSGANTATFEVVSFPAGSSFIRWEYQWDGIGGSWTNWGTTNPYSWNPTGNCGRVLYARALTTFGTCSAYSNIVSVTNDCAPSGSSSVSASQVCEGTSVSINTNVTSGNWVKYQYQLNGTGGSWIDWAGATQAYNWTPGASDGGTTRYIRAVLSNGSCSDFYTTPVSVQVDDPPSVGFYSNSGPIVTCNNNGTIAANTVFGATGSLQWQYGTQDGSWANWFPYTGINSGSSTFPVNPVGGGFAWDKMRITTSNGLCPPVQGAAVAVQNKNTPAPSTLTADVTSVCVGYVGNIVLTATFPYATNSTADVISDYSTVQFYSGSCGGTLLGTAAHVNGIATLTVSAPASNTTFYARGTSSCETSTCLSVSYTVNPQPVADTIIRNPVANSVCEGDIIYATFAGGYGGGGSVSDIYEVSTNGGSSWSTYVPGDSINTTGLSGNNVVRVRTRRISTGQNCTPSTLYNEEFWNVHTNSIAGPTQTVSPNDVCPGTIITLSTNSIAGFGSQRNWYDGPKPGGSFVGQADIFGELQIFAPNQDEVYYLYLENGACGDILADSVAVNVYTPEDNVSMPGLQAYNNLPEACTIDGWTYYSDPADSEKWLFAINKNGNTATFDVDLDVAADVISSVKYIPITSPAHGSYLMKRYWNVNLTSGTIDQNGGISIRFFYDPADLIAAYTKRDQDFLIYNGSTKGPFPQWFKTNAASLPGGGYGFLPSLIAPGIGNDWNFGHQYLGGILGSQNGVAYVEFNDLTSLSGGTGGTTFGEGQPLLPVELISFTATPRVKDIYLEWITETEVNNAKFEVMRSEDAIVFEKIGEVAGNGTTSERHFYDFIDSDVEMNKLYYYKLVQVDFDNSTQNSNIVSAIINIDNRLVIGELVPNPAFNYSSIEIISPSSEDFKVLVTNMMGQEIDYLDYQVVPGSQSIIINVDQMAPGNYLITLQSSNGMVAIRKLQVIK